MLSFDPVHQIDDTVSPGDIALVDFGGREEQDSRNKPDSNFDHGSVDEIEAESLRLLGLPEGEPESTEPTELLDSEDGSEIQEPAGPSLEGNMSRIRALSSRELKSALKNDILKTIGWISIACFGAGLMWYIKGRDSSLEFVTGYIVEYSLSVDNLFVFLLIFRYFKVPRDVQERVLFLGILGAMVLRGVMILLGEMLYNRFEWVSLGFAALLIYSAAKLLLEGDDDDEDLDNNRVIRFSKKVLPVADRYHGDRFFVIENSRVLATPLMVVLVSIELSDVVFALDSVPAVLGISADPFVIYPSNILAVMGLRSLYFVISDAISELRFLRQSLALVLGFVGIKMISAFLGKNLGIVPSLLFVICTLSIGIILSVLFPVAPPTHMPGTNGTAMTTLNFNISEQRVADAV